ncbi:hypothetical protein [Streptomyces sp. CB00455]|uniref:hypothetical protein n=1 Tax=Streptomyces sp. CB00455 TaxID=1703927 RepID=UPI00116112E9|nr:hypothetical protein [Streptomyces sp. CB00455]
MRTSWKAAVITVGGGAVGLAPDCGAARRGRSVLVRERFSVGDHRDGPAGLGRRWRVQHSEERWSRRALDTLPLWCRSGSPAGRRRRLVRLTGSPWSGRTGVAAGEGKLRAAASAMGRRGVRHAWLRARVHALDPDGTGAGVRTDRGLHRVEDRGLHRAESDIVNAGAYSGDRLERLGCPLGTLSGRIPDGERVVVRAGGRAFTFVPAFGRICSDLALGGHTVGHDDPVELR